MWNIAFALGFMALGGLIVHISWRHAWSMYKKGKAEGQDKADAHAKHDNAQLNPPHRSVLIKGGAK